MFNCNAFKNEYIKAFKKNSIFLKNQKGRMAVVLLLTVVLILSLALLIYYLLIKELIPKEFFYVSIVALLGWLFALLTNIIHTKQKREDNLTIQNNEIRKRLEVETFKKINKMVEEVSIALAGISLHYENHKLIKKLSSNTYNSKQMEERFAIPWAKYNLTISAHEIVLTRFNDLKHKLDLKFKKLFLLILEFGGCAQRLKEEGGFSKNNVPEIEYYCRKIDRSFSRLIKGLADYSIELQNKMLGEIFHSKIQKPKDR